MSYCTTFLSVLLVTVTSSGYIMAMNEAQPETQMSEESKEDAQKMMLFKHALTEKTADDQHKDARTDVISKHIAPNVDAISQQVCPTINTVADIHDSVKNSSKTERNSDYKFTLNSKAYYIAPRFHEVVLLSPINDKVIFKSQTVTHNKVKPHKLTSCTYNISGRVGFILKYYHSETTQKQ